MEDLIKALQILLKYDTEKDYAPTNCEHDYFYVNISPDKVSEEDIKELDKLGFTVDEEYDGEGFGSFRFGSC